jgi:alpha-glucosidase
MTPWWQTAVIYQIYPRSLKDVNGDGVGDLRGILEKLDYFVWLGVDALWLSPIFRSPMADFGYDVSDYQAIDPLFGTLDDFDALLAAAHARGLRLILDFVPNHTSNQHTWFVEARSSRDNAKRDWYIWRDPAPDGGPPNNWLSYFGGPAWTFDEPTGQYYLHNFDPAQPEFNYRNSDAKRAMFDQMRFWMDRGVDGLRVDVIDRLLKDPDFRDNPPDPDWQEGGHPAWSQKRIYSEKADGTHALIRELGDVLRAYPDRLTIGEIDYSTDPAFIASYAGTEDQPEIELPFNFALTMLPWNAARIRSFVDAYDALLPTVGTNYVLGNHDQPRIATRVGEEGARVAAMLLLTLRGAAFIYQGDELGMTDGYVRPDQYRDPMGINTGISRDGCRTPFQWDASPGAGFTTGLPWLPIADHAARLNVEVEQADPSSMLSLYRALIALRRSSSALTHGAYASFDAPEGVFAFTRTDTTRRLAVFLNFTREPTTALLPDWEYDGQIVLSTHLDREGALHGGAVVLRGSEGVIVELL